MADSKLYQAVVPLVIAKTTTGDRYIYQGGVFADDELIEGEVDRLIEGKFIEPLAGAVELPDGDPTAQWKVEQLKAYAEAQSIDLGGATKKDDILAVLVPSK